MGKKVRIKLDRGQIIQLVNEPGVRAELTKQAQRLASAAGSDYRVQQWQRRTKAVVNVVDTRPRAFLREALTGNLARALSRMSR